MYRSNHCIGRYGHCGTDDDSVHSVGKINVLIDSWWITSCERANTLPRLHTLKSGTSRYATIRFHCNSTVSFDLTCMCLPLQSHVDVALFQECARIGSALVDKQSCTEALAWCGENRGTLKKTKVGLALPCLSMPDLLIATALPLTELSRILPASTRVHRALPQETTDGCLGVCTEISRHMARNALEGDRTGNVIVILWTRHKRRHLQGKQSISS